MPHVRRVGIEGIKSYRQHRLVIKDLDGLEPLRVKVTHVFSSHDAKCRSASYLHAHSLPCLLFPTVSRLIRHSHQKSFERVSCRRMRLLGSAPSQHGIRFTQMLYVQSLFTPLFRSFSHRRNFALGNARITKYNALSSCVFMTFNSPYYHCANMNIHIQSCIDSLLDWVKSTCPIRYSTNDRSVSLAQELYGDGFTKGYLND